MDRIDLHIDVPPVDEEKLTSNFKAEASAEIRKRVVETRAIQTKRFRNTKVKTNGEMGTNEIKKFCFMTNEALSLSKQAISQLSLSARSYFKVIKISQTIADLEGDEKINESHIAEALQYRLKDE